MTTRDTSSVRGLVAMLLTVAACQLMAFAVSSSSVSEMRDVKLAAVAHMRQVERAVRTADDPVSEMRDIKLAAVAHLRELEAEERASTPADEMRELKALARAHDAFLRRVNGIATSQ